MGKKRIEVAGEPAHVLSTFVRKFRDAEERALDRHLPKGITARDVRILAAVAEVGAGGVSALTKYLGVSQPTVSIAIARLEKKGLIEHDIVKEDLRRRSFALTLRGKQLDLARREASGEAELAVFTALPKAERARFELFITSAITALP